jgi:hypothetical protein
MSRNCCGHQVGFLLLVSLIGCQRDATSRMRPTSDGLPSLARADSFLGSKGGDEREVGGIKLCWCPPGRFRMGSPPDEPERRPDEGPVEVTLTKGFWMGKYAVTQGEWKRVVGKLPGELTAAGGEGDDLPVYNVNYAEAKAFCLKLTKLGRQSGDLPTGWEFRLPTEAQREYACLAGTTTATAFGDKLSSKQANFQGKPYNGAEKGPSLNRASKVGSYAANACRNADRQAQPSSHQAPPRIVAPRQLRVIPIPVPLADVALHVVQPPSAQSAPRFQLRPDGDNAKGDVVVTPLGLESLVNQSVITVGIKLPTPCRAPGHPRVGLGNFPHFEGNTHWGGYFTLSYPAPSGSGGALDAQSGRG